MNLAHKVSQTFDFLVGDAVSVARQLIGWRFYHREPDGTLVGGVLSETEAYHQDDAASHSYNGLTERNRVMFGPPGFMYVYFTYGMHWCTNIVTGPDGNAQATLLRALIPDSGVDIMRARRPGRADSELASGPAKLCQALNISGADNGKPLSDDPNREPAGEFVLLPPTQAYHVEATPRIGITKNRDVLWRFVLQPV